MAFNEQRQPKPMRDDLYWRYQKQSPPKDEYAHLNGEVIVTSPVPEDSRSTTKPKRVKRTKN